TPNVRCDDRRPCTGMRGHRTQHRVRERAGGSGSIPGHAGCAAAFRPPGTAFATGKPGNATRQHPLSRRLMQDDSDTCAASDATDKRRAPRWRLVANLRRALLTAMVLAQTALATETMRYVLPYQGGNAVEIGLIVLFALLFMWIS